MNTLQGPAPKLLADISRRLSTLAIATIIVRAIRGKDTIEDAIAAAIHVKTKSIPATLCKIVPNGPFLPNNNSKK